MGGEGIGSGMCPMAGFHISSVETSSSTTRHFVTVSSHIITPLFCTVFPLHKGGAIMLLSPYNV
jgi:hypothetical protein